MDRFTEKPRAPICPHCGRPDCQGFLNSIAGASNRKARRGMISQQKHGPPAIRLFDQAQIAYNQAINDRNTMVAEGNLAEVIYKAEPVHARWIDAARTLSLASDRVENHLSPQGRSKTLNNDLYRLGIRGTSLFDVEQMPLPLSGPDIKRVLGMVRFGLTDRFFLGKNAQLVGEMMVTLPALDIARPKEVRIPQGISPLHERLTNFFDYYTGFLQQPFLKEDELIHLLWAMTWGHSRFYDGLGLFIPARLGITPASATKLLAEKEYYKFPIIGARALNQISLFIKNSYRKDGLPANLADLQDYNPGRDKDFSRAFLGGNQEAPVASLGGVEEIEDIFDNFRRFQALTRGDILKTKDRQLRMPNSDLSIAEITVSTQYKNSLTFLVCLANGEKILLEVNGINRLFGIPAELLKEDPNINAKLAKTVLAPFVNFSKQQHPEKHQRPVIKVTSAKILTPAIPKKTDLVIEDDTVAEIEARPPKRKRGLSSQASQELPKPVKERQQVYRVDYNRTTVAQQLKLHYDHELVERFMQAIKGFEWGEKRAENIYAAPGHVRIRVGKRRIALEHLGGTGYALRAIDPRNEVYSKKGLSRLRKSNKKK